MNIYVQLASCFMQLAAPVSRHKIVHFHCLFEGKMLIRMGIRISMGITMFKIFIWRGLLSDIGSEITFYGSAYKSP